MFRKPTQVITRIIQKAHQLKKNPPLKKWNIVKGDTVEIIEGTDAGKQGLVTAVLRRRSSLIVQGCKMNTRIARATAASSGYIYKKESPIHYSNVQLLDPVSGKPTRVHRAILSDGSKVRIANKSGAMIPKPESLKEAKGNRKVNEITDTDAKDVMAVTYVEPDYEAIRAWLAPKREAAEAIAKKANEDAEENRRTSKKAHFHRVKGRKVENRREVIRPKVLFTAQDTFPAGFIYAKKF